MPTAGADADLLDRRRRGCRASSRSTAAPGRLSFVSAPDYENPTDAGGNNVYDVTVQVSDGTPDRHPGHRRHASPTSTTMPRSSPRTAAAPAASVNVAENTTAVTTVTATDADAGSTLTYSIVGGADAAKFTDQRSTGALSFVSAPDYENPTDAGGNNVYDVTVQVSDGTLTDTQAIAVTRHQRQRQCPGDHLQWRRRYGVGQRRREQHGRDDGHGHRPRCRIDAHLLDRRRRRCRQVHDRQQHRRARPSSRRPTTRTPTDVGGNNVYDVTVQVSDGNFDRHPGHRRHASPTSTTMPR